WLAVMHAISDGIDRRYRFDVVRRHVLGAQRCERDRVARVEAADHYHEIERLAQQLHYRVLTLLRGAADRVERAKVGGSWLAPRPGHGASHLFADRERFTRQHRRLVRDADPAKVLRRIEARRHRVRRKVREDALAARLALDVRAHEMCLVHIPDHEVMSFGILPNLRRRRSRLLVVVLAVDQSREPFTRVALHTLPYVENRTARGVHEDASQVAQVREVLDRHTERRQDHHVLGTHAREVEARPLSTIEDLDSHVAEASIHIRVMDDLAHEKDPAVGKLAPGLVRVLHRPFYAVAEAKLARQADRRLAHDEGVILRPKAIDQIALVSGQVFLHLGFETETLPEIGRRIRRRYHGRNLAVRRTCG